MTNARFDELFGGPARAPDAPLDQRTMDLAASIQQVTDEIVLQLARTLRRETGQRHLCLAGGVALNCVSNGLLLREGVFDAVWIQPAAGDAGGALGAALYAWHRVNPDVPRRPDRPDSMQGALLGPETSDVDVERFLVDQALPHETLPDDGVLATRVAGLLADGAVVGWVQGRMEFGPRALGARSILADPRRRDMQKALNLKIKFRESFRPFAPAVLAERLSEFFDLHTASPYMLLVAPVRSAKATTDRPGADPDAEEDQADVSVAVRSAKAAATGEQAPAPAQGDAYARLAQVSSSLPAITHVDGSARVQTVDVSMNPRFRGLIDAFGRKTGVPVLVNTSFNVRGEPIVCTPADAYRCFMATGMDYLVLGRCVLDRRAQPAHHPLTDQAARQFAPD
jgi:carbamoyltransferase